MKLLVGGLMHDRGAITDCYLCHLRALDISGLEVEWFFVCDNDNHLWAKLIGEIENPSPPKWIEVYDEGPAYIRHPDPDDKVRPDLRRLAFLRNLLRERALYEQVDALVNIDSDIIAPVDLLQRMVAIQSPWMAAVVDNSALLNRRYDPEPFRVRGQEVPSYQPAYNVFNLQDAEGIILAKHAKPDLRDGGESDCAGAVCLYRRELLERVRWQHHPKGEDIGFALAANRLEYRARYLPLLCEHLMTEERLQAHRETCPLCRI